MILISGATGFIGTHLLKGLCENNAQGIRALYRSDDKKEYTIQFLKTFCSSEDKNKIDTIEWLKADILNIPELEEAYKGITLVFHCAAWVGNSSRHRKMMRKVNIEGTANMVNLAISHKVEKFCHVSSTAALGYYGHTNVVDENAPRDSEKYSSFYSISKYGAEMEVWRASQEGLGVVIVNPGIILGAGFFEDGSGKIFQKVINGNSFYINKRTGFVYVNDVIEFMIKIVYSPLKNERYILVSQSLSFKTVMDFIAETFKVKKPKIRVRKWMLYIVWFIQKILGLFKPLNLQITINTISKINKQTEYDNSKSEALFDFEYTSIKKAIDYIYKDYKTLQKQFLK